MGNKREELEIALGPTEDEDEISERAAYLAIVLVTQTASSPSHVTIAEAWGGPLIIEALENGPKFTAEVIMHLALLGSSFVLDLDEVTDSYPLEALSRLAEGWRRLWERF